MWKFMARCGSRRERVLAVDRVGFLLLSRAIMSTLAGMTPCARVILLLLAIDAVLSVAIAVLMLSGYFC